MIVVFSYTRNGQKKNKFLAFLRSCVLEKTKTNLVSEKKAIMIAMPSVLIIKTNALLFLKTIVNGVGVESIEVKASNFLPIALFV